MENGANSSPIPSDWDRPFTDEELEAIEAAFRSASSTSSSSIERLQVKSYSEEDHRRKTSRRLPDSLFAFRKQQKQMEGSSVRNSDSFSLLPCPRNRFYKFHHSSYQDNLALKYPTMNFGGHIVYSRTVHEVGQAAEELLKFVETKRRDSSQAILGFDIEWKPTFRRGVPPGKAAVLQICGDISRCHVMHIIHSGIPQNLKFLLEDPSSLKVGVCIANDAVKLFKDHNVSVKALEDLSYLANQKFAGNPKNWSLESQPEKLICKQLPKPTKIRLGNWEADVLSKEKLQYAATDAFVSWYLYEVLKSLPDTIDDKIEEKGSPELEV